MSLRDYDRRVATAMTFRSAPPRCAPLRAPLSLLTSVPRACTVGPCRVLVPVNASSTLGATTARSTREASKRTECVRLHRRRAARCPPARASPIAARRRPPPSLPEPPFQTASALSIRTAAQPPTQIGYPDSLGVRYRCPAYPDSLSASPIPSPSQLTSIPPPMCVRSLIALALRIRIHTQQRARRAGRSAQPI